MRLHNLHYLKSCISKVLGKIIVDTVVVFLFLSSFIIGFFFKQMLIKYAQTN